MTMTLTIDEETERLARELSRVTGKSVDIVLREALVASAIASGIHAPTRRRIDMAQVRATLARVDNLPMMDHRSPDEIIGYDEFGLPR